MTPATSHAVKEPPRLHRTIKDWPSGDRPREKLLTRGPEGLSDAELLTLLIGAGSRHASAFDLARHLLTTAGSLRALAASSAQDILQVAGIGAARAVSVAAAFEIGRRVASATVADDAVIRSPADVGAKYVPRLQHLQQELFMVLTLNSANRITREVVVTRGLLNSSLTHPREVFRPAILELAASVVLLHNHPSGNGEPSDDDVLITKQLVEAGKIIGIPVHDHLIIAGNSYTSFAERGLL